MGEMDESEVEGRVKGEGGERISEEKIGYGEEKEEEEKPEGTKPQLRTLACGRQ